MPTVKQLKQQLAAAGLSTEGKKAELEARLDAHDAHPAEDQTSPGAKIASFLAARADYAKRQADAFNRRFRK